MSSLEEEEKEEQEEQEDKEAVEKRGKLLSDEGAGGRAKQSCQIRHPNAFSKKTPPPKIK